MGLRSLVERYPGFTARLCKELEIEYDPDDAQRTQLALRSAFRSRGVESALIAAEDECHGTSSPYGRPDSAIEYLGDQMINGWLDQSELDVMKAASAYSEVMGLYTASCTDPNERKRLLFSVFVADCLLEAFLSQDASLGLADQGTDVPDTAASP